MDPWVQREPGSIVQHLCISVSCDPIHVPLDQGRSALKDACPSVKRKPLIHIAPGKDCAPTAGETNTELLGRQTPHPWRGLSTFGDAVGKLDVLILFHACGVGYSNKHPLTISLEAAGSEIHHCAAHFPRKCSLKSLCSAWRKTASHARTFRNWEAFSPQSICPEGNAKICWRSGCVHTAISLHAERK